MTSLNDLEERLEQGFYVDNLYKMAGICKKLAAEGNYPLPFFIMEHIFRDIADRWDERPITVEDARLLQSSLMDPIENLIRQIKLGKSVEDISDSSNSLVSAYLATST